MTARYLTPDQVAERWQYPLSSVWKKIRRGDLRAMNVGTPRSPLYRIPISEVERFERERTAA